MQEIKAKKRKKPPSDYYVGLGKRIAIARKMRGLSQSDVAYFLDVTYQQMQKYEAGTNRIAIEKLISLSDILDVPLSSLLDISDEQWNFSMLAGRAGRLLDIFQRIPDDNHQKALISYLNALYPKEQS